MGVMNVIQWTVFIIIVLNNARLRAIRQEKFQGKTAACHFYLYFHALSKVILTAADDSFNYFSEIR